MSLSYIFPTIAGHHSRVFPTILFENIYLMAAGSTDWLSAHIWLPPSGNICTCSGDSYPYKLLRAPMGNVFLCLQLPRPSSRPITSSGVFLCQWRRLVWENQKLKRKDNKKRERENKKMGNMTWYGAIIDPAAPHLSLLHLWCLFPSAQLLKCVRKKERVCFPLQQHKKVQTRRFIDPKNSTISSLIRFVF